jgi:aspartate oxidase
MGGPPFDPKAFAKLPAATRRELAARHKWEEQQLEQQRELGIQRANETLAEAKKQYEDAKRRSEADEKKAVQEAIKSCSDSCLQRPLTFAQCLQRTQAVEDVEICEHR